MPIQIHGVLLHTMSGTELSRVRTEFQLRLPKPINKSALESRGPILLCNQIPGYGAYALQKKRARRRCRALLD